MKIDELEKVFSIAPAWTSIEERELLSSLANDVPAQGLILEIGCLYGGTTAILGLSNPHCAIVSIDEFSWQPEGYPPPSAALVYDNMKKVGVDNVTVLEGDSRIIAKSWVRNIDLLWIDGGHSYQYVYSDLFHFSKHAYVIALHDYGNPAWESIKKAVDVFLGAHSKEWYLDKVVGMVAVLRRK